MTSFFSNAQLDARYPFFSDSLDDYYYLNYGVSLCNPKDGNYEDALKFLQDVNLKKNSKNVIYLEYLISFQTEGRLTTFEKINNSQLNEKDKDFLKLWLFAVTHNDNDFTEELNKNQKKYYNDLEIKKIDIRKKLQDRHDLIYTNFDIKSICNDIDQVIANQKLSKDDELFFSALKLDFEYYLSADSKTVKTERDRILKEYSMIWKLNKSYFKDNYTKLNFKLKSNNRTHYFDLTNEDEPDNGILEDYLFIMYGNPIQDIAGSDNKKYIDFINTNPFYYGKDEGGFNLSEGKSNVSPKKIKSKESFVFFLNEIENIINRFPGAVGPKYTYIDALIVNKEYVYSKDIEIYQTKFLKRIIDIFILNPRADFDNHFDYFRDFLKEDITDTNSSDYYKLIFKQVKLNNEKEINNYIRDLEKKNSNNVNLKNIANEFHNL
ncbi:hypothetical protein [Epilithonimonas arachidiradicis]|uniref:hypothetical protein n=1 Tax=Epilithonimonas arachidiradicis TaxID=1617282 RepID=UPI0011C23BEA|nr:hypothetical protein [Epilithonimonas arachidiradicis]